MKRTLQLVLCLFFFSFILKSYGQTETNIQALQDLSIRFNSEFEKNRAEVIEYARIHNIPVRFETEDAVFEMQYIDEFGKPQYYKTENKNAAATISTNKVNTGGGAGLNLNGSGMTLHEWDGGGVLLTHQEFGSRVTMGDATSGTHYHSTHVAGTMVASGVDGDAKGMAPEANLIAFDWNSDNSEMITAATNGALISNHSYGFSRGWAWNGSAWIWNGNTSISSVEDYLFGFYDANAQAWDEIAYNAPYYLICKSAGNDRGDGPGTTPPTAEIDGGADGYDCIGSQGVAKNILTVGAINDIPNSYEQPSDVVMSSFSCWGPADDGRIKPDIVANGVGLYSTYDGNNTDYNSISGTSMATPNAAGSLILLQEHYENLNGTGNFMRAATLKALIIHTADEAGPNLGPDYMNGWGLLNIERAAAKITEDQTNDVISEHTLNNGGTYTTTITATSGYPIKVTVVWTDPKGTPTSAQLDPSTKMLVNDLDLRVTSPTSTVHFPWSLSGTDPANAATRTGENNIDNVQVVYIENPTPGGVYTIRVDHDNTLASPQAFSMIISGYPLSPTANFFADIRIPQLNETVSFSDASTNNPTSWSWSISPATFNFVNSTNSSSQNPQVKFTEIGTYIVTLSVQNSSGANAKIKTNYIFATNAPTGYCDAYSTNPYGTINQVQFGTIDNLSDYTVVNGNHYYEDFTSLITDLIRTESNNLTVSSNYTNAGLDLGVWIDWNRDGDFDDTGENVVCEEDGGGVGTFSISVPVDASLGHTRMRLRTKYYNSGCGSSCGSTGNGEVEDYSLNIKPLSPPVADFTTNKTGPLINTTISFTDQSMYTPTSWLWSFDPSTVSYVEGTSSSSQNPKVQFTVAGIYEVSLYAENAIGNHTNVKSDYITAYNLPSTACAASGGGNRGYISGVQLNTINNTGTSSSGYYNYTSLTTELNILENYSITVTNGADRVANDLGVWVDWNQDGDFDDIDENIVCEYSNYGRGTYNFNVPATASIGSTRLRVRTKNLLDNCGSPCGTTTHGEVEDYTIIVTKAINMWYGTTSDWATTSNWSKSTVPTSSFNVTIPATPVGGSFPEISLAIDASCNKLTILNGANLQVFGNLTIDGKLKNDAGTSGLVVKSNASGTGSLITNTNNVDVTVERYFVGGRWHLFGAPVANQTANSIYFDHNPDVWLKTYIESSDSWSATISDLNTAFPMGKGFALWVKTGFNATSSFEDQLNSVDFLVNGLEYTDASHGFNLLANPFAAALDWDQGSWVRTNLDGSVWVYDKNISNYRVRNSVGIGNLTNGIIPSSQGFFVRTTASGGSISIPANARVHSNQAFYKNSSNTQEDKQPFTLAAINVSKGEKTDETWFIFNEACTNSYDNGWDVYKFFGDSDAPQLYAVEADDFLSVDALPVIHEEIIVSLDFIPGEDGDHLLTLKCFENFEGTELWLEDVNEETLQEFTENPEYNFYASIGNSSDRFLLHFIPQVTGIIPNSESNYSIYSWKNSVYIKNPELESNATVEIVDIYGRIIYKGDLKPVSLNKIDLNLSNSYLVVKLTYKGTATVQKVFIR